MKNLGFFVIICIGLGICIDLAMLFLHIGCIGFVLRHLPISIFFDIGKEVLSDYLNASRIPPGLYTMPGYFVRQVRVNTWIVCFLSRHNGPIPRCMGDVGMTRCRDILDEFPLKNAVAA